MDEKGLQQSIIGFIDDLTSPKPDSESWFSRLFTSLSKNNRLFWIAILITESVFLIKILQLIFN